MHLSKLRKHYLLFYKKVSPYLKKPYTIIAASAIVLIALGGTSYLLGNKINSETSVKTNKASSPVTQIETMKATSSAALTPKAQTKPSPQPSLAPNATSTHKPTAAMQQPTATPISVKDTTAPTITSMTGPENGSTVSFNNFCFPMYITDNVSKNFTVRFMFDSTTWNDWSTNLAPCFNNVSNGSHTFSVQVRDEAGNVSSTITRTFTILAGTQSTSTPTAIPIPTSTPIPTPTTALTPSP